MPGTPAAKAGGRGSQPEGLHARRLLPPQPSEGHCMTQQPSITAGALSLRVPAAGQPCLRAPTHLLPLPHKTQPAPFRWRPCDPWQRPTRYTRLDYSALPMPRSTRPIIDVAPCALFCARGYHTLYADPTEAGQQDGQACRATDSRIPGRSQLFERGPSVCDSSSVGRASWAKDAAPKSEACIAALPPLSAKSVKRA